VRETNKNPNRKVEKMKRAISERQIMEEYDYIGNDISVVSVDIDDESKRGLWVSGCNMHRAFKEMVEMANRGQKFYVCWTEDIEPDNGDTWSIDRFVEASKKFNMPWYFGTKR
jgi:hypothetical protein